MLVGKLVNQLGFLLEIVNALQLRLESFGKGGFNRAFIHATLPVVADLLLHRGSTLFFGRGRFQCLAQHCLIPLLQRTGYAPGRAVRRNGIGGKEFAASVLVKICAGIDLGFTWSALKCSSLGSSSAGPFCWESARVDRHKKTTKNKRRIQIPPEVAKRR